ncbi:MAG: substrate-binding domain-containing protein [Campylobacterota bacterium]|nr:substrate-binding domain-containing protein [Campylobacterota bacterium]
MNSIMSCTSSYYNIITNISTIRFIYKYAVMTTISIYNNITFNIIINSDNIKIGEIGAQYIIDQLDKNGTVLLLEGLPNADVTQLRTKGFMNIASKYPNIKIEKRVANYLRKDAISVMEGLLDNNSTFDAIFSESDSMLAGVRSVFKARGIDSSKIITIGCDYTSQARQAIQEGLQSGSVKFPLAGKESAEAIKKLIANETVDKHIVIPVELVTKENVDKVEPIF